MWRRVWIHFAPIRYFYSFVRFPWAFCSPDLEGCCLLHQEGTLEIRGQLAVYQHPKVLLCRVSSQPVSPLLQPNQVLLNGSTLIRCVSQKLMLELDFLTWETCPIFSRNKGIYKSGQSTSAKGMNSIIRLQAKVVPTIRSFHCPPLYLFVDLSIYLSIICLLSPAFMYLFLSEIWHFVCNRDIYEWNSWSHWQLRQNLK